MMTIEYDRPNFSIRITGHVECPRSCGAISMLMRGYGVLAVRYISMPGEAFIQMDPRDALDYEALVHGLECIIFFNHNVTIKEV